jgi:CO/xanthine dehydrogenase Mo-binding subunit
VDTAIAQMVAEELDVEFDRINVVMGDTELTCNQGGASGSTAIFLGGVALRNAAAEARQVLLELAAAGYDVTIEELEVGNGVINLRGSDKRITYGELIGNRYFHHELEWNNQYGNSLTINGRAVPKHHSAHRIVGMSYPQ